MARDSGSNKIAMSRSEVAELMCPTTQMAPLFDEGTHDEPLALGEDAPTPSGEHPALVSRDSLPAREVFDLRMSGIVPIEDPVVAPLRVITIPPRAADTVETPPLANPANDTIVPVPLPVPLPVQNRSVATTLGVAPLEPATKMRAPFVIDTPVPRWSPLARTPQSSNAPENAIAQPQGSTRIPTQPDVEGNRHERIAMIALDPTSGMPRSGTWQALVAVAKSLGSVRWWVRRRKTSRVKPLVR